VKKKNSVRRQDNVIHVDFGIVQNLCDRADKLDESQETHEEAVALYEKVLEIRPTHVLAMINLGNIRVYQGRTVEATRLYLEAVWLDPKSAEGWYNLGYLDAHRGQYDLAIEKFQEALRLDPYFKDAKTAILNAKAFLGQHEPSGSVGLSEAGSR
jgi:tetratricopeptide (TPR) repeat protein